MAVLRHYCYCVSANPPGAGLRQGTGPKNPSTSHMAPECGSRLEVPSRLLAPWEQCRAFSANGEGGGSPSSLCLLLHGPQVWLRLLARRYMRCCSRSPLHFVQKVSRTKRLVPGGGRCLVVPDTAARARVQTSWCVGRTPPGSHSLGSLARQEARRPCAHLAAGHLPRGAVPARFRFPTSAADTAEPGCRVREFANCTTSPLRV